MNKIICFTILQNLIFAQNETTTISNGNETTMDANFTSLPISTTEDWQTGTTFVPENEG